MILRLHLTTKDHSLCHLFGENWRFFDPFQQVFDFLPLILMWISALFFRMEFFPFGDFRGMQLENWDDEVTHTS